MALVAIVLTVLVGMSACGNENPAAPMSPVRPTPTPTPSPTPTPTPVGDFVFNDVAFDPSVGIGFDLGYPTADWDKKLIVAGDFTAMRPAEMLPAAVGIVLVCDDGSNGLVGVGGGVHSYPEGPFPQSVYMQTWVGNISYDSETHHWDTLECPIGHEVNGIFLLSQKGKTWRDLMDTDRLNKIRWDLVPPANRQFIRLGWKVTG